MFWGIKGYFLNSPQFLNDKYDAIWQKIVLNLFWLFVENWFWCIDENCKLTISNIFPTIQFVEVGKKRDLFDLLMKSKSLHWLYMYGVFLSLQCKSVTFWPLQICVVYPCSCNEHSQIGFQWTWLCLSFFLIIFIYDNVIYHCTYKQLSIRPLLTWPLCSEFLLWYEINKKKEVKIMIEMNAFLLYLSESYLSCKRASAPYNVLEI